MDKLELYKVVPNLNLPSTEGRNIKITDYKQKNNLLLYFYSGGQCFNCLERLRSFAALYESYKNMNTEILGISSDQLADSKLLKKEYRIPFPLLSDSDGKQMDKLTKVVEGEAVPSVLILDRFGSLYSQWVVSHEEGDLPEDKIFLQTLEYIETQCPECGIFPEEESA
jgi:peroxiredoxin Q/BCP